MEARSHLLGSRLSQTAAIQLAKQRALHHKPYRWDSSILFSHTHRLHKHPEHMVPSAKHSIENYVDKRGVPQEKLTAGGFTSKWCMSSAPLHPLPPVVQSRYMSEAFKWGGSAPEAARAATAGLNQETDRAEGGHTLGCEGGVHGSAGPALCMYDRDRI